MKKIITFIVCFMIGLTFVHAYDYTVEINPDDDMVNPGGEVYITIYLSGVNPSLTEGLEKIDIDLVYNKNVFEFNYSADELNGFLPSYGGVANQRFVIVDENPTYGLDGHTYSDPTTGKKYSLIVGSEYIDGSSNSELQDNPFVLLDDISFTVKDNAPTGTYKIGINPTYNGDQVTYSDVINVTVAKKVSDTEFIHGCIITSYNKEHSANKELEDTLTEAEYKSITNFECDNSKYDGDIEDISELYNLVNLKNLIFNANSNLSISSVNLSKFPNVEKLSLGASAIQSIDLSHNPKLTEATLYTSAKNLDFSNNLLLKKLNIVFGETIDLSKNTELEELLISETDNCTSLDLTNNIKLKLISEDTWIHRNITLSENEKKNIQPIVKLPSHIRVTKVSYSVDGKKVKVDKNGVITGVKAGKDIVSATYEYTVNGETNPSYTFVESFAVKVEKGIVNPKTGVVNAVVILIVMALIGFVSYIAIRHNNSKISLQ